MLALASVDDMLKTPSRNCILTFLPSTRAERSELKKKKSGPIKGQCIVSEDVSIIIVLEIIVCLY